MYDQHQSIERFLAAAAAKQPTPGGGSVAALTAALSAAMGEMVLNYSVGRKGLEPFQDELKSALTELTRARGVLLQLMVEDQQAYEAFTEARKLPDTDPATMPKRLAALEACIRVPQSLAATSTAVLEVCDRVLNFVNPHLLSDLAVCADLAMAATRCAVYNVRVNLPMVSEERKRQEIETTTNRVLTRAAGLIQAVSPRIWARVGQKG